MTQRGQRWTATLSGMLILLASPHATRAEPSSAAQLLFPAGTSEPASATASFEEEVVIVGRGLSELSGEARVWDDRLSLSVSESYGRDVFDGRRVLTSRHLDKGANWQREADFSFSALSREQNVTLSVSGGLYDAQRPFRLSRQRLRLGEVDAWGEHRGADIGLDLGLFGDRLRYEGGYAWSDYGAKFEDRELARQRERRGFSDALQGAGDAHRHRIEADLLTGGPLELSAYGLYQAGARNFRMARRSGASLSFTAGEISEIGASLGLDGLRFGITWQDRAFPAVSSRKQRARWRTARSRCPSFRTCTREPQAARGYRATIS
jgi:hypothetical protein